MSVYVGKAVHHFTVDKSTFSSSVAEYVVITLRIHGVDATVLSIYIRPGVSWDPRELLGVH